jgi:hypothetical protein
VNARTKTTPNKEFCVSEAEFDTTMRGALSAPALVGKKKYAAKTPITIVTEIEHRREPGKVVQRPRSGPWALTLCIATLTDEMH